MVKELIRAEGPAHHVALPGQAAAADNAFAGNKLVGLGDSSTKDASRGSQSGNKEDKD